MATSKIFEILSNNYFTGKFEEVLQLDIYLYICYISYLTNNYLQLNSYNIFYWTLKGMKQY